MAGTTHYKYIFTSKDLTTWEVVILDTTYTGEDFDTLNPASNGFDLSWEGAGEQIYQPIIASTLNCSVYRTTESKALLDAIIEGPEQRFLICVNKLVDPGYGTYELFWKGFILQDSLTKPDTADYTGLINLSATDGFGYLKNIDFTDFDVDNIARESALAYVNEIIRAMLRYDEYDTNYAVADYITATSVYTNASVWYEDSMDSSVLTDPNLADPLANTQINQSAFIQVDEYGVAKGDTLYDMLTKILNVFNLQISQCNGTFLIIQQNTYVQEQTRFWDYDYANNEGTTRLGDLKATMPTRLKGGDFNYILPAKEVTTEYEYRQGIYRNNLLPRNVDDTTEYALGFSEQGAEMFLQGTIETIYNGSGGDPEQIVAEYKLLIQNGTKYLNINTDGEQEWTTDSGNFVPVYSHNFKSDYSGDQTRIDQFNLSYLCNIF